MNHSSTSVSAEPYLVEGLTREYLLHHLVSPLGFSREGVLHIATQTGSDAAALDDLSVAYRCSVVGIPVRDGEVEVMIERLVARTDRAVELARHSADDDTAADVRDLANQPPVIRYVNLLVRDAYDAGASDIHLESMRTGLAVRFRVDGVLVDAGEPAAELNQAIVSRIKLLAELDIAERRRPQDGRIRVRMESRELDLRVSTVPNMFGESVVLRLLDQGGRPVGLEGLGMPAEILSAMVGLSGKPHGIILVTGPTGSGKTTTLYAALGMRNAGTEKIVTVEDPVEYQLTGITQVPVHRQVGVTFATALRAILRQDPDVVMVGEMRDAETAEIALQAAMTGHLVFSTLHTNDAIAAVPRLLDLGMPRFLIAATLEGVLAQRLVRRICDECRAEYQPSKDSIARLAGASALPPVFTHGVGCAHCRGTGYRGRVGIFELLVLTAPLREAINGGIPQEGLRQLAEKGGMLPIGADGWGKVVAGQTTVEEVMRVVQQ